MSSKVAPLFLLLAFTAPVVAGEARPQPPTAATTPAKPEAGTADEKLPKPETYSAKVPAPSLSGVKYGQHERHVLDFWKAESDSPTPLVFVIHGGGWVGGSKERVDRFVDVPQLLKAGISVVSINYRLIKRDAPDTEPPVKAPLHDAARALQFVRSKAAEWNLDKTRVGAAGGSR